MSVRVTEANGRVRFGVRVQPRAARTEIAGLYGDALKVRLSAPPVEGAANEELVNFLADVFAVGRRDVTIVSGTRSRLKIVEVVGVTAQTVVAVGER
jgi:uncharacterized protein (TIGR00251 family)